MTQASVEIFQALRQIVHNDPALQARLFDYATPDEFLGAVRQLAQAQGFALEDEELQQLMRANRRAWFERNLP